MAARAVSWVGSAVTLVALPLVVYQESGSAAVTALLAAMEVVPLLGFGLVAGAVADRFPARLTMIVASLASTAVMTSLTVLGALGSWRVDLILAAAFVIGTCSAFFDAANFVLVAELVPREDRAHATSLAASLTTLIFVAVPPLGGALVGAIGPASALGVDAASFAAATLIILRGVPRPLAPARPAVPSSWAGGRRSLLREAALGLRLMWRHRLVRPLTLVGLGNSFAAGAVTGLVVVIAVRHVGAQPEGALLGVFYAASSAGTLAGALAVPRLMTRSAVLPLMLSGLFAAWASMVALAVASGPTTALVSLVLFSAASSIVAYTGISARTIVTPQGLQGRVNASARTIAWAGQPLGSLTAGVITDKWSLAAALMVCSAALGAAAAIGVPAIPGLPTRWRVPLIRPPSPSPSTSTSPSGPQSA